MFLPILTILLLLASTNQVNSCSPKFLLSQTLHDSVNLYTFNTSSSITTSDYSYSYFQKMFTSLPTALISISQFKVSQFTSINYVVSTTATKSNLNIHLQSQNMTWSLIQIQFIVHSRKDIFSTTNTINNIASNQNITAEFSTDQTVQKDSSYVFVNFIIGIIAGQNSNYKFGVNGAILSDNKYLITTFSNTVATFTVQTIYFDSSTTLISTAFNQLDVDATHSPQYRSLYADFAPVIYSLIGFGMMSISGNSLDINATLDMTTNLIKVSNSPTVNRLNLNYFAFGELPSNVCSPCDSFISVTGCLTVCPNNSYSDILKKGGKTCRICSPLLGQSLTTTSNSCVCNNSQIYIRGNCYDPSLAPVSCPQTSLLIEGKCLSKNIQSSSLKCSQNSHLNADLTQCTCDSGYQLLNGKCVTVCPNNALRNSDTGLCQCKIGYLFSASKICESVCPTNSYYSTIQSVCFCNTNYEMISGKCVICSSNQVYDATSRKCMQSITTKPVIGVTNSVTIICGSNQVIINDNCQCDSNSIRSSSGKCVSCAPGTYKYGTSCISCSSYCSVCSSGSMCSTCQTGFFLASSVCQQVCGDGRKYILACDDGNVINGDGCSSSCNIQYGWICSGGNATSKDICTSTASDSTPLALKITSYSPVYTSPGIITDFIIKPAVRRSQFEIQNLFKITFSNPKMRPNQIIYSQSESDLTSYRCFFSYQNSLPNSFFTATFQISANGQYDHLTIIYDAISNPIKSAIHFLEDDEQGILH